MHLFLPEYIALKIRDKEIDPNVCLISSTKEENSQPKEKTQLRQHLSKRAE